MEDNFFVEIINHLQTTSTCLILTRPLFDRTNSAVYRQFGRLTLEGSVCHLSWVPGIQGEFYVTGLTETYHFTAKYDAETQAAVSFQFPSYLLFFDTHPLIINRARWEDGFSRFVRLKMKCCNCTFMQMKVMLKYQKLQVLSLSRFLLRPPTPHLELRVEDAKLLGHQNFALLMGRWTTEMALYVRSHPLMQGLGQTTLTAKRTNQPKWW